MELKVNKINNEETFKKYLSIVDSFDIINPFYKILGLNLIEHEGQKLRYFTLNDDNGIVIILMPFILRSVPYKDQKQTYYDVVSPYGYSGPLFNYNISRAYLIQFWELVDKWYKENNIISEFVRFSLNNNYQFYSGKLIPTLSNVRGKIIDEELQWVSFKGKVRNNYRRSISSELTIKVIQGDDLNPSVIQIFHNIYIETMSRLDAKQDYFYSLNYFKNIIELNKDQCLIAFVYKGTTAISTELVLILDDSLYSYLGGTLSEFFDYRPNDFLKIEIMKWARIHNYSFYVLGGGRNDQDNLYKYKKTFFPNDMDVIYYTGRKIIRKKIYNKLDTILNMDVKTDNILDTDYFPSYRKYNH